MAGRDAVIPPSLSVVVVTHGAWSWSQRALGAIREHTEVDHETIVVDNASSDGTPERVRQSFPDVRLVANPMNAGFGAANNQAAALARAPVLAFVNSDAIVPPGWDGPLVCALERTGVGAVVPALLNTDGTLQGAGALVAPDGSVLSVGAGDAVDDPAYRFPRATDFGAAACMLVRRDTFLHAGGFDPVYDPAYFEDVDLCLRLAQRGLRTLFVPDVRVTHGGFASGGPEAAVALFERSRPVFTARWGERLADDHPPTLWPVHPARTLAARDAGVTGRVLVAAETMPRREDVTGAAIVETLEASPWLRITLVTNGGSPEPWLRRGVEVVLEHDLATTLAQRAGHYDVVIAGSARDASIRACQPQAVLLDDPGRLPATIAQLRLG